MNETCANTINDGIYVIGSFKYASLHKLLVNWANCLKKNEKTPVTFYSYETAMQIFDIVFSETPIILYYQNNKILYHSSGLNFRKNLNV